MSAARTAWPGLAGGLPASPSASLRNSVSRAATLAAGLPQPRFLAHASRLTGPAAGIAGLYESFARLAERGWRMIDGTLAAVLHGPPAAARFARANSSLYIHAVYDGHYNLSLIGKAIGKGYERLGGSGAFGRRLTATQLDALAAAYSIAAARLAPHPREAGE